MLRFAQRCYFTIPKYRKRGLCNVIDEKKITIQNYNLDYDIDTYFKNIVSQGFIENIKDGKVSIPGREEINGNKALLADVTGKIEQNNVYYKLALVESPYDFTKY